MLPHLLPRRTQLAVDRGAIDLLTVAVERPLPRQRCVLVSAKLEEEVAEVVLDCGVAGPLRGRRREGRLGQVEFVLAEVGPPEAVEVGAVVRV